MSYINESGLAEVTTKLKTYIDNKTSGGYPIEIDNALDMDALLVSENVGKVYLYTGTTTSNYTNGNLYVVEEQV